ncbi:Ig-like domain-containing protein [Nocardiopsis exhalans]|uniref:Ig-like domain-containing protein n=1 Tax=Nocardiopsis exhalans TaxID=163604 RepID=A0ABY5DFA5_9ACTN|nr:Ig-like domain-containing protein [Nocardiopsis exhalans]USY21748.1 Ig-like domain-containing protein [Nocardiopsis exhalans]
MPTQQCSAALRYSDDSTEDVTEDAVWASSDEDVAEVNASGLVVAVGAGECQITATHSGLSGSAEVTVSETSPESEALSVSPSEIALTLGGEN